MVRYKHCEDMCYQEADILLKSVLTFSFNLLVIQDIPSRYMVEGQPHWPPLHIESLTRHSTDDVQASPLPFSVNIISQLQVWRGFYNLTKTWVLFL